MSADRIQIGARVRHTYTGRVGTVVATLDWLDGAQELRVTPDHPLHEYGDPGPVDWLASRVEVVGALEVSHGDR